MGRAALPQTCLVARIKVCFMGLLYMFSLPLFHGTADDDTLFSLKRNKLEPGVLIVRCATWNDDYGLVSRYTCCLI
jgi:hypothetical protein